DQGYTPAQISRMEIDRAQDALLATPAEPQRPDELQARRAERDPRPVIGRRPADDVPDAA
ncbi:phage portal protein, partial [Streptomyces roseolus]